MAIIIKNNNINKIMRNGYNIKRVYRGDDLVFPVYETTIYYGFDNTDHGYGCPDIDSMLDYLVEKYGQYTIVTDYVTHYGDVYEGNVYKFTVANISLLPTYCDPVFCETNIHEYPYGGITMHSYYSHVNLFEIYNLNLITIASTNISFWSSEADTEISSGTPIYYDMYTPVSIYVEMYDSSNRKYNGNYMLYRSRAEKFDLSKFDTHNFESFKYFLTYSNISTLDLSNIRTNSATSLDSMLYYLNVDLLDVSHFNVNNVNNFYAMFAGCCVQSINVNGWNVKSTACIYNMFSAINDLTTLDLSSWNLHVTTESNANSMFVTSDDLTTLNISGWKIDSIFDVDNMFDNCENLTTIYMYGCDATTISIVRSIMPSGCTIIN